MVDAATTSSMLRIGNISASLDCADSTDPELPLPPRSALG
jgi:hypothetical protein